MAGDMNRVTLVGRLGRDPESRTLNGGGKVVSFSMATTESWRDKSSGEKVDRTQWHQCVIWNEHIGKVAEQYLTKGSKCLIEGQVEYREYDDKDGVKCKVSEIVLRSFDGKLLLLGDKSDGDGGSRRNSGDFGSPSRKTEQKSSGRLADEHDQDIPF